MSTNTDFSHNRTAASESPRPVRAFRTIIRGHAFASIPPDVQRLTVDTTVRFVREPGNPADPLAVAVWTTGATPWRLGYLDRSVAAWLAPRLDADARLGGRVVGWVDEPSGRWARPLVLVEGAPAGRLRAVSGRDAVTGGRRSAAEVPGLWGRRPGVARRTVA
ncbi:MAG: HIRAN domain-containing protein [Nitriliruptoraceae bacterium]